MRLHLLVMLFAVAFTTRVDSVEATTDSKVTAGLQTNVVAGERNLRRHFSATEDGEEERAINAWVTEGFTHLTKSSKAAWTDEQLKQLVKKATSADEAFKLIIKQNPEKQVSMIKTFTNTYGDEVVAKMLYTAKSKWWTRDVATNWQNALFQQWIHEKKSAADVYMLLGLTPQYAYTDPFHKLWWEYVSAYAKAASIAKK